MNRARRAWRYRRRYARKNPQAPREVVPFSGPVVVVGSAPVSTRPEGFSDTFRVIAINGSQGAIKPWGVDAPDVTFMQFNQVEGTGERAVAVRRVLTGERCGTLYVIRWPKDLARLKEGLAAFDYRYDRLETIDQYQRSRLAHDVLGRLIPEADNESKFSNGLTAVFYALANGASAVIITGIDPGSAGHVYNDLKLERLHSGTDAKILAELVARGFPVFTADRHVAEKTGLPLWTGQSMARPA
ncbi:membrane-anchored protein [Xaviernesmea oryzae]|uniref:Membrane-anchored protein n=1 Tax=Xaviernesmea oryzae TaxID=464029 RepID=A0A1Q9AWT2_9HYPH|nr:membrane-anchored protein [Xaviernesmea oryzae]